MEKPLYSLHPQVAFFKVTLWFKLGDRAPAIKLEFQVWQKRGGRWRVDALPGGYRLSGIPTHSSLEFSLPASVTWLPFKCKERAPDN